MMSELNYSKITTIAFVCSSGIGASAMGSAVMSKVVQDLGLNIEVKALAMSNLTDDYDLIITHRQFASILENQSMSGQILYISNYLDKKLFEEIGVNIQNAKRKKTGDNQINS